MVVSVEPLAGFLSLSMSMSRLAFQPILKGFRAAFRHAVGLPEPVLPFHSTAVDIPPPQVLQLWRWSRQLVACLRRPALQISLEYVATLHSDGTKLDPKWLVVAFRNEESF